MTRLVGGLAVALSLAAGTVNTERGLVDVLVIDSAEEPTAN